MANVYQVDSVVIAEDFNSLRLAAEEYAIYNSVYSPEERKSYEKQNPNMSHGLKIVDNPDGSKTVVVSQASLKITGNLEIPNNTYLKVDRFNLEVEGNMGFSFSSNGVSAQDIKVTGNIIGSKGFNVNYTKIEARELIAGGDIKNCNVEVIDGGSEKRYIASSGGKIEDCNIKLPEEQQINLVILSNRDTKNVSLEIGDGRSKVDLHTIEGNIDFKNTTDRGTCNAHPNEAPTEGIEKLAEVLKVKSVQK